MEHTGWELACHTPSHTKITTSPVPLTLLTSLNLADFQENAHSFSKERNVEHDSICWIFSSDWQTNSEPRTGLVQTWNVKWAPCGNAVSGGRQHTSLEREHLYTERSEFSSQKMEMVLDVPSSCYLKDETNYNVSHSNTDWSNHSPLALFSTLAELSKRRYFLCTKNLKKAIL